MIKNYKIANVNIKFNSTEEYFHKLFSKYETNEDNYEMLLTLTMPSEIVVEGELTINKPTLKLSKQNEFTTAYYLSDNKCYASIIFDKKYTNCKLRVVKNVIVNMLKDTDIAYMYLGMLFNYHISYNNSITLHGSAIKFMDEGLIFTAPSGVGKSTQSALWQQVFGDKVELINDDKPTLVIGEKSVYCYGTPFSGKNHLNINDKAKLKAIINVVRGKENRIEKLSVKESVVLFLEETTRSTLNEQINYNNMQVVSQILQLVPVYRLYCTPDTDAVEVAYKALYEGV